MTALCLDAIIRDYLTNGWQHYHDDAREVAGWLFELFGRATRHPEAVTLAELRAAESLADGGTWADAEGAKVVYEKLLKERGTMLRKTKYNWGAVDWQKNDTEISKELGCDNDTAGRARKRLGKPASPKKYHGIGIRRGRKPFNWDSVDWSKRDFQIASELGCSREYVRQNRRTRTTPPVIAGAASP